LINSSLWIMAIYVLREKFVLIIFLRLITNFHICILQVQSTHWLFQGKPFYKLGNEHNSKNLLHVNLTPVILVHSNYHTFPYSIPYKDNIWYNGFDGGFVPEKRIGFCFPDQHGVEDTNGYQGDMNVFWRLIFS